MNKYAKQFYILLVLSTVILLCFMRLDKFVLQNVNQLKNDTNCANSNVKYVLYWTKFWYQASFEIGFGFNPFKTCEYKNCYATSNRTFIPVEQFDALLFHISPYNKRKHGVPKKRRPQQIYIGANMEAPINLCPNLRQHNLFFNWTMSYRFDSDIIKRHGVVVKGKFNYTTPSRNSIRNKTGIAAWLVSHCRTSSKRELLVKKIQKHIPVDVYGRCGPLKCPKKSGSFLSSKECYKMIESKYKFYFSFENSYCKDYATEKVYNVILHNVVPVVYGDGNYNISTPPKSVINAVDFKNTEDLANYLLYLDKNEDAYLKYLEWKKEYMMHKSSRSVACQICKRLNEPIKQSIYRNLHDWWWGKRPKPICRIGQTLPKIVHSG